jgi:hypothetical protein
VQELCKLLPEWIQIKEIGTAGKFLKVMNANMTSVKVQELIRERLGLHMKLI